MVSTSGHFCNFARQSSITFPDTISFQSQQRGDFIHTILKVKFLFKNLILTKPQRRKKWRFRTVCYTRLIWVFQTEPQTWEKMDNNWHVVSWRPQRPRRLERSPFDNFSHLGTNLKKKKKKYFLTIFSRCPKSILYWGTFGNSSKCKGVKIRTYSAAYSEKLLSPYVSCTLLH